MTTCTMIWIRTQFVGFHRYRDAPDEVAFLRDWHRHVFHVRLGVQVTGLNREVEFFTLKKRVDNYLTAYANKQFESSCEQIADNLMKVFGACLVEVAEDGENGATAFDWIEPREIPVPKDMI